MRLVYEWQEKHKQKMAVWSQLLLLESLLLPWKKLLVDG